MSETTDKPKLGVRAPLGIKRTVEVGKVKQSFSHGRSNTVVVETKKRRILGRPGEAEVPKTEAAPPPAPTARAPEPAPAPKPAARPVDDAAARKELQRGRGLPRHVEEIEKILLETKDIHSLGRGSEAIDIVAPEVPPSAPRKRRKKK